MALNISSQHDNFVTVQKPPSIVTKLKYLERKFQFDQCDRTFNFLKVDL